MAGDGDGAVAVAQHAAGGIKADHVALDHRIRSAEEHDHARAAARIRVRRDQVALAGSAPPTWAGPASEMPLLKFGRAQRCPSRSDADA